MAEDTKLTSAEFAAKIKAKYPQYAAIPDDELTQKIISKHPEYTDKVALPAAKPASVLSPEEEARARTLSNMTSAMSGQPMANPEDQARAEIGKQAGFGAGAATVGSMLAPVPAAEAAGVGGTALRTLLAGAGAAPGVAAGQQNPTLGSVAGESALYAAPQPVAEGGAWLGEKLAPMASQALARTLRLSPKAFQFGREPAEEVLTRGLATGNLKEMVGGIGEASKQVTSELNTVLKNAPGTVDVFQAATDASKSIPNPAAANRFEQTILDAADKLGLKNLDKVTNLEANALKQEVAKQAKIVEGDLRLSVSNASKIFGGKVKDSLISNAPKAKDLLESSANLTEASKAGDYAVRMEKAGRTASGLSAVDIKKPSTYPRLATDTITGARTLFNLANMLKDHTSVANALRVAFQMVYPGAEGEQ